MTAAKPWWALIAVAGLAGAGCLGNGRHHHGDGFYGGQGGDATGGGGQGGSGGGQASGTPHCAAGATPSFTVQWSLEDSSGQPTTCAAVGGATMDLDVLNVATSEVTHDTFGCDALAGTSAALTPGDYSIAMRLRDAAGSLLSEAIAPTTYTVAAGCVTDLGAVPFEAVVTASDPYITLSWSIDRVLSGAPLTCADAKADKVALDAGTTTFTWSCATGKGATAPLAPGSYDVTIKLLDAAGTPLSVTPTMPVVVSAGQQKALGTVLFDVN
jgi:hypothetical protein